MIRELKFSDLWEIEEIHKRSCSFPLPNINDSSYIVQKTIEKDGKIVGAIFVQLTSEVSLVVDSKLSNYSRARLIKEAIVHLVNALVPKGIKTAHVFILPEDDTKWASVLTNHCGFTKATGIPLYLEVK